MIESFRHKGLQRFHEKGDRSAIGANMVARVEEILAILEAADSRLSSSFIDWQPERILECTRHGKLADYFPL